ncbi:MAG TPA: nucleotidyltransferase family protein [Desulfuromonadales bacterium]|nr:nucleotidyltransferase family protein [Desulfuromonadales bacterium]
MAEKAKKITLTSQNILAMLGENEELLKKRGVRRIGLFGSFARNQGRVRSDLDFLVEFESPTFDNYMNLAFSLEKLFGRRIDLVTPDSLSLHVRPYIEKEVLWHEA